MPLKISVVTVARNARESILATLRSVQRQSYPHIEHIVIDGLSTDGTREIIEANRQRVAAFVSEQDSGIYDAMNKGIRLATGDVIGFLNADDVFYDDNVVEEIARAFERNSPDLVYGDVIFVDPKNGGRFTRHYSSKRFHPGRLAYGWMPAHPTLYVKKALYDKYGLMKTDYEIAADFEFIARVFQSPSITAEYLDRVFVVMRTGGKSTRGLKSTIAINREIRRACRENNISTNYFMIYSKYLEKLLELRALSLSEQAPSRGRP